MLKKCELENSTFFIDAANEFVKVTNSNKLTQENINKIVNEFTDRKDIKYFVRLAPNNKIAEQDYTILIRRQSATAFICYLKRMEQGVPPVLTPYLSRQQSQWE